MIYDIHCVCEIKVKTRKTKRILTHLQFHCPICEVLEENKVPQTPDYFKRSLDILSILSPQNRLISEFKTFSLLDVDGRIPNGMIKGQLSLSTFSFLKNGKICR